METETCDTCVWATRFKDGLRCIDGMKVNNDDGCRTWMGRGGINYDKRGHNGSAEDAR